MKFCYVAGPYTGRDWLEVDAHINVAREASAWLARNGVGYYCPHLNSAHFDVIVPEVPIGWWYEMDYQFVHACGAMLVLPGYEKSFGTQREIDLAATRGMPIFYWCDDESELAQGELGNLIEWAQS